MAMGGPDLQQTAERVWGALDRMADEDPEGYKKFIEEQMKEGNEAMATPEPVLCVKGGLQGGKGRYVYLNVCKWSRVPHPKTDNDPIPVKGGVVRHLLYKDSKRKTQDLLYDVAFHPHILETCLKHADLEEMLLSLCWDYVENETDLKLTNRSECKKLRVSYKGIHSDIRSSLDEEYRGLLTPDSKLDIGDSILTQLREMKLNKKSSEDPATLPELKLFPGKATRQGGDIRTREDSGLAAKGGGASSDGAVKEPRPPGSKMLIQELRSEVSTSYQSTEEGGRVCVPEHCVDVNECEGGGREVCVVVKLPGVRMAKDVDLEVSQNDLVLDVSCQYHLTLQFPETVKDELVRAKFNRKLGTMTVTLPCTAH